MPIQDSYAQLSRVKTGRESQALWADGHDAAPEAGGSYENWTPGSLGSVGSVEPPTAEARGNYENWQAPGAGSPAVPNAPEARGNYENWMAGRQPESAEPEPPEARGQYENWSTGAGAVAEPEAQPEARSPRHAYKNVPAGADGEPAG